MRNEILKGAEFEKMNIEEIEKLDRSYLTADEVTEILGISRTTFYRHRDKMQFPIIRIGRKIHIPKEPFLDYLRYGEYKNVGEDKD